MGHSALYKCNECGNEFRSQEGGGFCFIEYRCVQCDTIKIVKRNQECTETDKPPTKEEIGRCGNCGGELNDEIKPLCPKCRSRDVKEKKISMYYD